MSFVGTDPNVVDLCRLCLGREESLIPVFDSLPVSQICDKINVCLAIQISSEDRISQKICGSCLIKVDSFYEFRNKSSESQKLLEQWLRDSDAVLKDMSSREADINIHKDLDSDCCVEKGEDAAEGSDEDSSSGLQSQGTDTIEELVEGHILDMLPALNTPGPSGLQTPQNEPHLLEELRIQTTNGNDEKALTEVVCKTCSVRFNNSSLLKKHMKETHSTFSCYCGAKFMSLKYLNRHETRHNAKPTIPCKLCNKLFITTSELKDHQKSHQLGEKISCHLCDYITLYKSNMSRHLKRHTKEYTVFCEACNEGFFCKDELDTHRIKKHGATPFFCIHCRKVFTSKSYLQEHNKTAHWTTTKDFLCETCGKALKTKNATKRHMKLHLGLKYACHICNKCVNTPYSLKKHMKAHTGEKSVVCYVCGKGFVDNKYMAAHLRSHTGERPYECAECGKRFTQASTLKVHTRYHTGERPYVCSFCAAAFVTNTLLTNHIKSHIPNYISNGLKN